MSIVNRATSEELSNLSNAFAGRANRILTPRLEIAPLTRQESELYLSDVDAFARKLQLTSPPKEPDEDTRRALNWLIDQSLQYDAQTIVWASIWAFVDRKANVVVGNSCFKGAPIDGDVEIGYGVEEEYRGRGYMTEALKAFVGWGRECDELRGIVAETFQDNLASQRALEKAGFRRVTRENAEEGAFFWRIDVAK